MQANGALMNKPNFVIVNCEHYGSVMLNRYKDTHDIARTQIMWREPVSGKLRKVEAVVAGPLGLNDQILHLMRNNSTEAVFWFDEYTAGCTFAQLKEFGFANDSAGCIHVQVEPKQGAPFSFWIPGTDGRAFMATTALAHISRERLEKAIEAELAERATAYEVAR